MVTHDAHVAEQAQRTIRRNRNIGWVFQNFKLIQQMSVFDNVALPLVYAGRRRSDIKEAVQETLDRLGIGDKGNKKPSELSGGQESKLHVLRDISLEISDGEFVAVMGPSGSGKSTFINIVGMLDREFEGDYFFADDDTTTLSRRDYAALRWFTVS
ncbi:ATP-binding cassette domain-containing protein [Weissella confusa]|uniref:ATP-binding cassette domain-containing protein n=1 Tax=Weissella confusa TaxID=1583 RepID=A0A923NIR7_WEICO|nr:ATP-binding cassette domain-containing protein [Weissella confusa]